MGAMKLKISEAGKILLIKEKEAFIKWNINQLTVNREQ